MKFASSTELMEYINTIGEDRLCLFDITFNKIEQVVEDVNSVTLSESAVGITSFSDTPSVTAGLDSTISENVLYVEDYDSVPMACSTGKVSVLGRTIFTNVCESDEGPTIYLNITLNETTYARVPFKLKKTDVSDSDYIMLLNPKTLTSNE